MIDLKKISKGKQQRPPRVVIYATDAVGKTMFAAGAPDPFFIDANNGSHRFDVRRVVPESWTETKAWLDAVETRKVECATLVLDSVTDLEALSHKELFPNTTIEAFDGGFGRGDTHAVMIWREMLAQIERIWLQGKNVVLVAHATVKTFNDPTGPSFDRFEVSCRPKLAAAIRQFSDYVLFAREEVLIAGKKNQTKATTTGVRWAYTRRCPAYDAKARGTLQFPERVPLDWQSFVDEIKKDDARTEEANRDIEEMLAEIGDATLATQVHTYVKQYPAHIVEARNRVAARLAEHRAKAAEPAAQ